MNTSLSKTDNKSLIEKTENQLLFLNSLKEITKNKIYKNDNKEKLKKKLKNVFDKNQGMDSLSDNQKNEIINLGFDILENEIEVKIFNTEADLLNIINKINEDLFLKSFAKKVEQLKIKVSQNKSKFGQLKQIISDDRNTINKAAIHINPKVTNNNNNNNNNNIDREIDDFLDGETMEF
jgi:hypothetical protein